MSRHTRKNKMDGGSNKKSDHVYLTTKMTMGPNTDPNYKPIGIIHRSETVGLNILRRLGTDLSNFFGGKGFDVGVYNYCRERVLRRMEDFVNKDQLVTDIKFDMETVGATVALHVYGTLCEKIKSDEDK